MLLEKAKPDIEKYASLIFIKKGALLVENHFFSTPKIVILEDTPAGPRIPENYADEFGADALLTKYHSYNFMAPGWKDPENPEATNQKLIFENVKIPFGLEQWNIVKENSWFNSEQYGPGEASGS